jgi:hypothetical protein
MYLIVLPLLHVISVSVSLETTLGNYTNVIGAGVSLLCLAEQKRTHDKVRDLKKTTDEIQEKQKTDDRKTFDF